MSEYESLREDIGQVAASLAHYSETAVGHLLEQSRQIDKLWADNAALRDDLHALANRVETLTRTLLAAPAEVAAKIVNDANQGIVRDVNSTYLRPLPMGREDESA